MVEHNVAESFDRASYLFRGGYGRELSTGRERNTRKTRGNEADSKLLIGLGVRAGVNKTRGGENF